MNVVKVSKMHGNGNDFIVVDEFNSEVIPEKMKPDFVRAVCHRRFGVGADGVLFVQRSAVADAKFRYFNSDGSEAEMCGNGIRCFSRYIVEEGYAKEGKIKVETLAGVLELDVKFDGTWWIKVDMGSPKFGKDVPAKEVVWGRVFDVNGQRFEVYAVNTGVPHAVVFVGDLSFDIIKPARCIRYHSVFPEGINVNFAKVVSDSRIEVRTYERGVEDETLSCGTGSVAVAIVANKLGLTKDNVEIITKGGLLKVEIAEDKAYLIGSANRVMDGMINIPELKLNGNLDRLDLNVH